MAEPTLLLLDEPTNHLDLATLAWLEQFLNRYPGTVLMVSHDRTFLDQTISRVLALSAITHQVTEYSGTYSDYATANY